MVNPKGQVELGAYRDVAVIDRKHPNEVIFCARSMTDGGSKEEFEQWTKSLGDVGWNDCSVHSGVKTGTLCLQFPEGTRIRNEVPPPSIFETQGSMIDVRTASGDGLTQQKTVTFARPPGCDDIVYMQNKATFGLPKADKSEDYSLELDWLDTSCANSGRKSWMIDHSHFQVGDTSSARLPTGAMITRLGTHNLSTRREAKQAPDLPRVLSKSVRWF